MVKDSLRFIFLSLFAIKSQRTASSREIYNLKVYNDALFQITP